MPGGHVETVDVRTSVAGPGAVLRGASRALAPATRRQRQLGHDLRHGLATVARLVEAIGAAGGLDRQTGERVHSLECEVRRLTRMLEEEFEPAAVVPPPEALVRVDVAVAEVVDILRSATEVELRLLAEPVSTVVSITELWRAVRNVVDNAVRAATSRGEVEVRVFAENGSAVVEVHDSGPGFGAGPAGLGSLGLGIVQDFVAQYDGSLTIGQGDLGGCCVRLTLPTVVVLDLVALEGDRPSVPHERTTRRPTA